MTKHAGRWVLEPARSHVRFEHKTWWGLMTVRGTFNRLSGQGDVGPDGAIRGTLVVDADSLDTKNADRDERVRSADFLNVAVHPQITYVVHGGEIDADARLSVAGELSLAGVTRPFVVTARFSELTDRAAVLHANVEIDRTVFGLTWNRFGMIRGEAALAVTAAFERQGDPAPAAPA